MRGLPIRAELQIGVAMFVCMASSAWAQPSASPEAQPDAGVATADRAEQSPGGNGIEDIIVTARRTAERVQDVPLSVTAVSGEALRRNSITSVADLYKISPSLTINTAGNRPAAVAVRIRSLAEQSGTLGQDPTVPIYFAEAVINRQTGVSGSLFDLSSVQVVKGPQGTLFGRSATGGAVLITPVRPTEQFEGYLSGTYGLYNRRELEGAVNLPIGDGLSVRLSGKTADRDGDIRNLFNGKRLGSNHADSGRASLLWSSSEMFETYFVADVAKLSGTPAPSYAVGYRPGSIATILFPGLIPFITDREGKGIGTNSINSPHSFKATNSGLTNITELRLGTVTVKNIANVRRIIASDELDADGTPFPILAGSDRYRTHQFSEELQLLGKSFDDRLTYVVGANYFKERSRHVNKSALFGGAPGTADARPRTSSKAVFAQLTYEVVQDLRVTAGARYTWDKRYLTSTQRTATGACGLYDANNVAFPEPCVKEVSVSFKRPSYTLGVDYKPSSDVLLYLAHRRGYRSGGFTALAARAAEFTPYKPEIVQDIEGGAKIDWRIGEMPLRTNIAIFYADYTNIQRTIGTISPGGVLTQTILNAAAAKIKGGEFEFSLKPTPDLEVSGYVAMSKARYDKFLNPFTGQDLSANRFAAAPDYMGRIAIDYTLPFSSVELGEVHLGGAYRAQSMTRIGDTNEIGVKQRAYGIADFRIDWENIGGHPLTLSAFITNAFDKKYISNGVPLRSAIGITPVVYGERRMGGITARVTFGND